MAAREQYLLDIKRHPTKSCLSARKQTGEREVLKKRCHKDQVLRVSRFGRVFCLRRYSGFCLSRRYGFRVLWLL